MTSAARQSAVHGGDVLVPPFAVKVYDSAANPHVFKSFDRTSCIFCETSAQGFSMVAVISEEFIQKQFTFGVCPGCAARHGGRLAAGVKAYWIEYWRKIWDFATEQVATGGGRDGVDPFEVRIVSTFGTCKSRVRCIQCGRDNLPAKLALFRQIAPPHEEANARICLLCSHEPDLAVKVARTLTDAVQRRKRQQSSDTRTPDGAA